MLKMVVAEFNEMLNLKIIQINDADKFTQFLKSLSSWLLNTGPQKDQQC